MFSVLLLFIKRRNNDKISSWLEILVQKYHETRHNVGYMAIDLMARINFLKKGPLRLKWLRPF